MDYIKGVYKRRVHSEIESYQFFDDAVKRDKIQFQDVLMLDIITT